jgi:AraC-like DNA-binding protein
MAITIDYTPYSILQAAQLAGTGEALRRTEDANLKRAQLMLEQQRAVDESQARRIQAALEYDRLRAQQDAAAAARAQQQARDEAELALRRQSLELRRDQPPARAATPERDEEVLSLLDRVYPDPTDRDRALLAYRATGRIPASNLAPPKDTSVQDLSRQYGVYERYLKSAVNAYGEVQPGYDPAEVERVRRLQSELIRRLQGDDRETPSAPRPAPTPVVPAPATLSPEAVSALTESAKVLPLAPQPNAPAPDYILISALQVASRVLGRPVSDPAVKDGARYLVSRRRWSYQ